VIVDAHHHLWDPDEADYPWMVGAFAPLRRRFDSDDLATVLEANGVAGSVVVQARASLDETRSLLATAHASPSILGVVGWVDLTSPGLADELAALRHGVGGELLVGVRHQAHDEADSGWLLRSDVQRGIATAGAAGLAYDLLVRERELPAAIELARRHPDVRLVLDHLGKPPLTAGDLTAWLALVDELAACENVSCKLSGIVTEAPLGSDRTLLLPPLRHALARFGPERSLFGSDWPVCLLAASYAEVLELARAALDGLDEAARDAVLGGTAARLPARDRLIDHASIARAIRPSSAGIDAMMPQWSTSAVVTTTSIPLRRSTRSIARTPASSRNSSRVPTLRKTGTRGKRSWSPSSRTGSSASQRAHGRSSSRPVSLSNGSTSVPSSPGEKQAATPLHSIRSPSSAIGALPELHASYVVPAARSCSAARAKIGG
jgi:L-fuconolactonase